MGQLGSGQEVVKVRPGRPVITSRQLAVFVFDRIAFCIRDNHVVRRVEPASSDVVRGSEGSNKAASLIRLQRRRN